MNYTEKYHLPQWVKSDRIMMDDFNQMCRDMEAGLGKTAQDAAAATEAAKQENAAAIVQAQNTANLAVSKADAAQATANAAYAPGKFPYSVGAYTGTGEIGKPLHITVGFAPRFVAITGSVNNALNVQVMGGVGVTLHPVELTENGFDVIYYKGWPEINAENVRYVYIAFR